MSSESSFPSEDEREKESFPSEIQDDGMEKFNVKTEFETIKEDYEKVLKEIEGKKAFKDFIAHYQAIFSKLEEIHNNEGRLKDQVTELQLKLSESKTLHKTLLEQSSKTINKMKLDLDKAHSNLDTSHLREQNLMEKQENLMSIVTSLSHEIEMRKQLELEEAEEGGSALKKKALLQRERDRLFNEKNDLVQENEKLKAELEIFREKCEESQKLMTSLAQELKSKNRDTSNSTLKLDAVSKELESLKNILTTKENEVKTLNSQAAASAEVIERTEKRVKEEQLKVEMKSKECEKLKSEILSLKTDIARHQSRIENLKSENANTLKEYKLKTDEVRFRNIEIEKLSRQCDALTKKVQNVENLKGLLQIELNQEQTKVVTHRRELEMMQKTEEANHRLIEELKREKEKIKINLRRVSGLYENVTEELKKEKQEKNELQKVKNSMNDDLGKQYIQVQELTKENKRLQGLLDELNKHLHNAQDELRSSKNQNLELRRKINELEIAIKQRENLYESTSHERSLLSRNLMEAKDEISDLKIQYKEAIKKLESLKDDVSVKEMRLLEETAEREKCSKEVENLRSKLHRFQGNLETCQNNLEEKKKEEIRLLKIITEADAEKSSLKKEVEQLKNDRDLLATQLIRKNEEISLLYEKIKILESSLQRGETQYNQRVEDIRLLKIEVKRLRQEKTLLERALNNSTDLRQEVYHLERDLMQERMKNKSLEEELTNPMNVHRWRKLEGTDPETLDLIQKLHFLQKRLLKKSAETEEQADELQAAKKLNEKMQKIIERSPGPDVSLKLQESQATIREHIRENKALKAELLIYQTQISQLKYDLEQTKEELNLARKNILEKKKASMKQKESEKPVTSANMSSLLRRKCHFMGGGFNTSIPIKS